LKIAPRNAWINSGKAVLFRKVPEEKKKVNEAPDVGLL
jgi:hypothetical protein